MSFITEFLAMLGYRNQKSPDGRLRISQQISLGDYKQYLNNAGGQFNTEEIGTGSATYEGGTLIGGTQFTTAAASDAVIRQSYQWHNYFAGKPQKIELTCSVFQQETNIIKRFGYFSSNTATPFNSDLDGMFFESNDTGLYCKIYRQGTEIFSLEKANWLNQNEITTYDPEKFNFYAIDFLYLGGAVCNFWIETIDSNGNERLTLVAKYIHVGEDNSAFVKSPNQPVRYELRQTGAGSGTFNQICADVATEGQNERVGVTSTVNTDNQPLTNMTQGTRYAVIGARLAAGSRNVSIDLTNFSVLSTSNDNFLVEIIFGGTTTGTIAWNVSPFSNVDTMTWIDCGGTTANAAHTGGVRIASIYVQSSGARTAVINTIRRLGSFIDGTKEEVFLCATSLGPNGSCHASGDWNEFI